VPVTPLCSVHSVVSTVPLYRRSDAPLSGHVDAEATARNRHAALTALAVSLDVSAGASFTADRLHPPALALALDAALVSEWAHHQRVACTLFGLSARRASPWAEAVLALAQPDADAPAHRTLREALPALTAIRRECVALLNTLCQGGVPASSVPAVPPLDDFVVETATALVRRPALVVMKHTGGLILGPSDRWVGARGGREWGAGGCRDRVAAAPGADTRFRDIHGADAACP
jgi:hypothetical protein